MNNEMIVKIEKCLNKLGKRPVRIKQKGFIISQFFIDKLIYKIQNDILNIKDKMKDEYFALNLNQVYQIEISENKIILFLDNDTEIEISI